MERIAQCLSPVHIWTGKNLEPFDYIVDGQRYGRIDLDAVLERLPDEQANDLAAWVSERADRIAEAKENTRRDAIRREMQLVNFNKVDLRGAFRTDPALVRYHGDAGFERSLQVREQAKDADDTPCIPGSSLKGALRTALAFVSLKEMKPDERSALKDSLDKVVCQAEDAKRHGDTRKLNRLQERIGQEIEKAIFRCGKHQRDNPVNYEDIHYDLMRAVSVSDTYDARAELIVPQIHPFVEQRDLGGKPRLVPQAPLIAEAHAPGNTFRLRLRIDSRLLRAISRNRDKSQWIRFDQRVQRTFGPEVAGLLPDASDEQIEQAAIRHIESAVRRFARAVAAAEQRWGENHGHGTTSALQDFYKQLGSLIGKGLVPLRLGWGSQFLDTTVLLALKEDTGWRSVLERCFRAFDIGVPPRQGKRQGRKADRKIDLDDFPRSRRLVTRDEKPIAPLGWIALVPTDAQLPGPLVEKERLLVRPQKGSPRSKSGSVRQAEIISEPQDPAEEEAKRIKREIGNLNGRGDVSKMPGIIGRIEPLPEAIRLDCAGLLRDWLKKTGKKEKNLWKGSKHASTDWRKKLDQWLGES